MKFLGVYHETSCKMIETGCVMMSKALSYQHDYSFLAVANISTCEPDSKVSHAPATAAVTVGAATEAWTSLSLPRTGETKRRAQQTF